MHPQQYYHLAILLAAAKITAALPLNINLGAYSPALVVGDGEISFGGGQDVAELMNTLQGAAVSAAEGAAAGGEAATVPHPAANTEGAGQTEGAVVAAAAETNLKQTATDIVNTLGTAQVEEHASLNEGNRAVKEKRDLSGFDRALDYAEVALTKGPKIQLGTEEAGVGIIIDPAAGSIAAPAAGAERVKRDVEGTKKRRTVTTVYVKGGIEGLEKREIAPEALAKRDVAEKRQPVSVGEAIDEVNVNLDARDGLTLTFVEEVEDEE